MSYFRFFARQTFTKRAKVNPVKVAFNVYLSTPFFHAQPHRTYYLEDPESTAVEWCKFIEEVHNRYFGDETK